ncbi:hypothetical protein MJG53_018505 [Ovis ammon polii x Ovis aries]|uniref:Uncharacterized protein n=1 Tax=Ovis ammon polii x Ovis aries TaxID=2918886 RepID=A0ACB9U3M2_9CETA|nr:hypothetical protein MJG53_018505 [Ovis ammon polii x Ovis aries]
MSRKRSSCKGPEGESGGGRESWLIKSQAEDLSAQVESLLELDRKPVFGFSHAHGIDLHHPARRLDEKEETLMRLQISGCVLICKLPEDKTLQFLPLWYSKEPYSCVIRGKATAVNKVSCCSGALLCSKLSKVEPLDFKHPPLSAGGQEPWTTRDSSVVNKVRSRTTNPDAARVEESLFALQSTLSPGHSKVTRDSRSPTAEVLFSAGDRQHLEAPSLCIVSPVSTLPFLVALQGLVRQKQEQREEVM